MLKNIRYQKSFIIVFLACFCLPVHAQNNNTLLSKILFHTEYRKNALQSKQKESVKELRDEQIRQNINRHLEVRTILRDLGKTEAEIGDYFHSTLKTTGTGSITGKVYQSDGVTPVSDYMSLWAYNEFGIYSGYGSIDFSNPGVYEIKNLPTGNYFVKLSTVSDMDIYYNSVSDWKQATLVHVTDGEQTGGIDFVLIESTPVKGTGAISGHVLGANSVPLSMCPVIAYNLDQVFITSDSTDSSGEYTVTGLPTGEYKLRAFYIGSENYMPIWYDSAETFNAATIIRVIEPDTTKAVNFSLAMGGAIVGKVVEETGESIPSYSCYIDVYDHEGKLINMVSYDSTRGFIISRLETGSYKLYIEYYGDGNYLEESWYDGASDMLNATSIHVIAPDTTKKIIVRLQRGGAISGIVNYSLLDLSYRETIDVYTADYEMKPGATCEPSGQYTVSRLPSGRYKLAARYMRYGKGNDLEPMDQWYNRADGFDHAEFIDVHAPDTTQNIDMTLDRGSSIFGKVFDPNGQPFDVDGKVYAYNKIDEEIGYGETDWTGSYAITGLPTGQYRLWCKYSGQENYASEWYDGIPSFESANIINVTAPEVKRGVNFTLEPSATLQGFVTDEVGNRLASDDINRLINVSIYEAENGDFVCGNSSSFLGGFQANLLGRNYKLAAFSVYQNWMQQQDSLAVTFYQNGKSFSDSSTSTIALPVNNVTTLDDLVMERASGAIAGTVYDRGTGTSITVGRYTVVAVDEQGFITTASGYSSGNQPITGGYRLTGLRPGTYYVLALAGIPESYEDMSAQWYDTIDVSYDSLLSLNRFIAPVTARPVTVDQGTTLNIDFGFDLSTAVPGGFSSVLPDKFLLEQNYPNPFNPATTIKYCLAKKSHVCLEIYNIIGQRVVKLIDRNLEAGYHDVRFDGSGLTSGVYFCCLRAGDFMQTRKLLLLR
jgi:hypothetical protein